VHLRILLDERGDNVECKWHKIIKGKLAKLLSNFDPIKNLKNKNIMCPSLARIKTHIWTVKAARDRM